MRRVTQKTYERMDLGIYEAESAQWWQPDSAFFQTKAALNPVRLGYLRKKLLAELKVEPKGTSVLDVGCGGGLLTEDIARMGFDTTGLDPSGGSVRAAAEHSRAGGLSIRYDVGSAEAIPYPDRSFNVVVCCDVLEHVRDLPRVISEIARVLKPGGVFVYDTFNRTCASRWIAIKICQVWKPWAFMPPNIHVWEMFIRPREMRFLLGQNGLTWRDHQGIVPDAPPHRVLGSLRRRAKGEWTYRDLAERVHLREGRTQAVMYLGTAVKNCLTGEERRPRPAGDSPWTTS